MSAIQFTASSKTDAAENRCPVIKSDKTPCLNPGKFMCVIESKGKKPVFVHACGVRGHKEKALAAKGITSNATGNKKGSKKGAATCVWVNVGGKNSGKNCPNNPVETIKGIDGKDYLFCKTHAATVKGRDVGGRCQNKIKSTGQQCTRFPKSGTNFCPTCAPKKGQGPKKPGCPAILSKGDREGKPCDKPVKTMKDGTLSKFCTNHQTFGSSKHKCKAHTKSGEACSKNAITHDAAKAYGKKVGAKSADIELGLCAIHFKQLLKQRGYNIPTKKRANAIPDKPICSEEGCCKLIYGSWDKEYKGWTSSHCKEHRLKCAGTNKKGESCGQFASSLTKGGKYCTRHGDKVAPKVSQSPKKATKELPKDANDLMKQFLEWKKAQNKAEESSDEELMDVEETGYETSDNESDNGKIKLESDNESGDESESEKDVSDNEDEE